MSEVNNQISGAQVLYGYLRARTIDSKVTARKDMIMHVPKGLTKE